MSDTISKSQNKENKNPSQKTIKTPDPKPVPPKPPSRDPNTKPPLIDGCGAKSFKPKYIS
jgi:hypothetical protein